MPRPLVSGDPRWPVRMDASRDLRLGLFALESGAIDHEQLVSAVRSWCRSRDRSLSAILAGRGLLDAPTLARLEDRVARDPGPRERARVRDPHRRPIGPAGGPSRPRPSTTPDGLATRMPAAGRSRPADPAARPSQAAISDPPAPLARRPGRGLPRLRRRAEPPRRPEGAAGPTRPRPGLAGPLPPGGGGHREAGAPRDRADLQHGPARGRPPLLRDALHRRGDAPGRDRAVPSRGSGATHRDDDRELAFRRLLRSVIDTCNAVAYAHSRGVVHRDLKPENIMLGRFGETLVVDWGVAKSLPGLRGEGGEPDPSATDPADASMTRPGSVIGTPRYMSPEQAAGDLERVGPASDIYSLGAILYCLLVGHAPFPDGDMPSVLGRVRRGIFPAPRRLRRSVDPTLEAICLKAMSPGPARPSCDGPRPGQRPRGLAGGRPLPRRAGARPGPGEGLADPALPRAGARQLRPGGARRGDALAGPRPRERPPRAARAGARHPDEPLRLARGGEADGAEPPPRRRGPRRRLLPRGAAARDGGRRPDGPALGRLHRDAPLPTPWTTEGPSVPWRSTRTGRSVATAGDDGLIRRWDALTGEPSGAPSRHGGPVAALGFSPDGSRLAAAGGPAGFSLWDAATGLPVRGPDGIGPRATAVAFSPDGDDPRGRGRRRRRPPPGGRDGGADRRAARPRGGRLGPGVRPGRPLVADGRASTASPGSGTSRGGPRP